MEETVNQLTSLQHYPKQVKFDQRHYDLIQSRGLYKNKIACETLMHCGKTCRQYQVEKIGTMFGKALKIAAVAIIPQLIRNCRGLIKGDRKRVKKVIEKFCRTVTYITIISTVPALLNCYTTQYYGRTDRLSTVFCFLAGTALAHMCESHGSHELYLGINFPRAIGLVISILETRGMIKQTKFRASLMLFTVSGLYGIAQSKEQKRISENST